MKTWLIISLVFALAVLWLAWIYWLRAREKQWIRALLIGRKGQWIDLMAQFRELRRYSPLGPMTPYATIDRMLAKGEIEKKTISLAMGRFTYEGYRVVAIPEERPPVLRRYRPLSWEKTEDPGSHEKRAESTTTRGEA